MIDTKPLSALPDPDTQAGFYDGVAVKRLLAWVVDTVLIALATIVVATLPLFIGWFFLPFIFLVLSILYRAGTIASASATPGMRVFNVELRNNQGMHLTGGEAVVHTLGYLVCTAFFLPQMISVLMILLTARGQALHDVITGTALINKPSDF
ncbi:MAG: RDD family protein [Litoreibacter sp.]|nr:RDD family protein [Litoreibacter sp.]